MRNVQTVKTILLFFLCVYLSTQNGIASSPGSYQQESKKAAKKLKDEGWSVFGSNKTLRESLDVYYKALEDGNGNLQPIEGTAKAKDVNRAIRKCQSNAAVQYASMMETKVEGNTQTQISNTTGEDATSQISFNTNYQSSTERTVKSLTPSVILYRTLKDGVVEVLAFFLVDIYK